jgi:hypothetical protein
MTVSRRDFLRFFVVAGGKLCWESAAISPKLDRCRLSSAVIGARR